MEIMRTTIEPPPDYVPSDKVIEIASMVVFIPYELRDLRKPYRELEDESMRILYKVLWCVEMVLAEEDPPEVLPVPREAPAMTTSILARLGLYTVP